MRLVLLSNSTNFGGGYLAHAAEAIRTLFEGARRIAFVPFALKDPAGYHARVRQHFAASGIEVDRVEEDARGAAALERAEGLFVGGGNTFRLLDRLQRSQLVESIQRRVRAGLPYLGSSAGTVITAPTLQTTNDMPIVAPASFEALGLVPFQINCHYLDADPASRHMGETRETRLREFLEENDVPVVGLREGSWIAVGDAGGRLTARLEGARCARLFRRGAEARECEPGFDFNASSSTASS
jgi:dipeptidase E